MNKSETILQKISNLTEETQHHTVNVHPDHEKEVDRYLKDRKIHHSKKKHHTDVYGYPYYGYGFRPDFYPGFMNYCHAVESSSGCHNTVTCNPSSMDANGGASPVGGSTGSAGSSAGAGAAGMGGGGGGSAGP